MLVKRQQVKGSGLNMANILFTPCTLLLISGTGFLDTLTTDTLYKHAFGEHVKQTFLFFMLEPCDVDNLLIRFF